MNGAVNTAEQMTHMDLNHDGRIGGAPAHHGHAAHGGPMNTAERITHTDLNHDGRIGGAPAHHGHAAHGSHSANPATKVAQKAQNVIHKAAAKLH